MTDYLKLADEAAAKAKRGETPDWYSLLQAVRELVARFNSVNSQHGDLLLDWAEVVQERDEALAAIDRLLAEKNY